MSKNYLYIFLHIPKTAGSTFAFHLKKNFTKNSLLHLSFENLHKNKVKNILKSLKADEKAKIKVIYGHAAFFGIHEYFDREARYFTFFRDPVERAVSIYNHKRRLFDDYSNLNALQKENLKNTLTVKGKAPEFEEWLERKFDTNRKNKHLSVYGFMQMLGFLERKVDKNSIKKALRKFMFIGMTEHYNEDSLFLYQILNINKFFLSRNISSKHYEPKITSKIRQKIYAKSRLDKLIYDMALKRRVDYKKLVKKKRFQKAIFLPFTQTVFAPRNTIKRILISSSKSEV